MRTGTWLRVHWDRVGAWCCIALGALALVIGWQGASRSGYPAEQLPYILSGGIGGALLVALGATLLITADLRDEWLKLDRIEQVLRERGWAEQPSPADQAVSPEAATRPGAEVGAPDAHRPRRPRRAPHASDELAVSPVSPRP